MFYKTKTGWSAFPSYLRGYSRNLPLFEKLLIKSTGSDFLKKVRERIKEQPDDVPSLHAFTVAKKAREGTDPRMWIETGFWEKHLGITQVRKGMIFAGASRKMVHKPSGKKMSEIGEIFEYGSPKDNIPPRPLFRPVMARFKKSWLRKLQVSGGLFFASRGYNKQGVDNESN